MLSDRLPWFMKIVEARPLLFVLGLLVGMVLMVELGRYFGRRQRAKITEGGAPGVGAMEAAVFGLLGLLIAFTFSGASNRFDHRRELIVEEANVIGTAWLRIDLLPVEAQPALRESFRQYLDSRLETYRKIPDLPAVAAELERTAALQRQIWDQVQAAIRAGHSQLVVGILPALNQMFDIVTTRTMAALTHPPAVVFLMLAALAFACAFIAGHGMGASEYQSWVHVIGFAAILSIVVFTIMDIEYARLGFVRVDSFDRVLVELRQSMN